MHSKCVFGLAYYEFYGKRRKPQCLRFNGQLPVDLITCILNDSESIIGGHTLN